MKTEVNQYADSAVTDDAADRAPSLLGQENRLAEMRTPHVGGPGNAEPPELATTVRRRRAGHRPVRQTSAPANGDPGFDAMRAGAPGPAITGGAVGLGTAAPCVAVQGVARSSPVPSERPVECVSGPPFSQVVISAVTTPVQTEASDDSAVAELSACFVLDAEPEQVAVARRAVARTLERWGFAGIVEDVKLCVSEAFTNAVLYAGGKITVTVRADGPRVTIEVQDGSSGRPTLRVPAESGPSDAPDLPAIANGGRGIFLITHLADDWGVRDCAAGGKSVWFTRDTSAPAARS